MDEMEVRLADTAYTGADTLAQHFNLNYAPSQRGTAISDYFNRKNEKADFWNRNIGVAALVAAAAFNFGSANMALKGVALSSNPVAMEGMALTELQKSLQDERFELMSSELHSRSRESKLSFIDQTLADVNDRMYILSQDSRFYSWKEQERLSSQTYAGVVSSAFLLCGIASAGATLSFRRERRYSADRQREVLNKSEI